MAIVRCLSCAGTENYHEPHCQQERDRLRAVNAKLVAVLKDCATALHGDRMHDGRFQDCERWGCSAARAVIEEARKCK